MKEFVVYTGLRILMFVLALLVVLGIWVGISGEPSFGELIWPILIAMVISGLASYTLLAKQRDAFARVVEARAARATAAFEQLKSKEDED